MMLSVAMVSSGEIHRAPNLSVLAPSLHKSRQKNQSIHAQIRKRRTGTNLPKFAPPRAQSLVDPVVEDPVRQDNDKI